MPAKSDLELVEDFQHGKIEGFNELVRRYQEKAYWLARRIIGSHPDADDIVQDAFVRVHNGLKTFRGESSFYTWLYRIVTNLSLNALRKKRIRDFLRYDEIIEETYPGSARSDAAVLQQEVETIIEKAMQQLPAKQRTVFAMRYYDELPYEEISAILKTSVGGLKANYFHAFKKIQKYVRKELE